MIFIFSLHNKFHFQWLNHKDLKTLANARYKLQDICEPSRNEVLMKQ